MPDTAPTTRQEALAAEALALVRAKRRIAAEDQERAREQRRRKRSA